VETPSDHTYSLLWAELSRLLGEKKIPVAIVGLEPGTPGSAVQRFNHFAPSNPINICDMGAVINVSFALYSGLPKHSKNW